MKPHSVLPAFVLLILGGCTSQEKLAYFNNLPGSGNGDNFSMQIPDYKIQPRDILYITVKAMVPDGTIRDFLSSTYGYQGLVSAQSESGGYLSGYDVNLVGEVILPVIGKIKVSGLNLEQARSVIQERANLTFKDATIECKLLSFKFTVIGEVNSPGSYVNYNNYLTVLEAIGRAGGISDYGRRDKILVVRPKEGETKTFVLNIQDKSILSTEAYFLLPNDVVIVEPQGKKIFNLNLPTFTAIFSAATSLITTTLLLINYFGK